jgi:parallel beta-helix repeat protein
MTRKDDVCMVLTSLFLVLLVISNIPGTLSSETLIGPDLQLDTTSSQLETGSVSIAETTHEPIDIVGDDDLNATALVEGWPGNGTSQNPYRIQGLSINLDGATGNCIYIRDTRAHFIISGCSLTRASVDPGSGICFNNVSNGEVTNNTCTDSYYGMYLFHSDYNILRGNICNNNTGNGIRLYESDNNTISNNDCSFNDLYGIYFSYSNSNEIANNLCNDTRCGVCFSQSNFNVITNNTCTNNVCGIRGYTDSRFSIIANNTSTDNTNGIRLDTASDFTVVNNTFVNNTYGVYLFNSVSCTVWNNTCKDNMYGIYVYTYAATNDIQWNVFADSSLQNGYDNGTANLFDYNYWSDYAGDDVNLDYIGDTPYPILGIGNYDQHPLMFPPDQTTISWVESPISWVIDLGESFRYDLNATAYAGIDYWWLNDTAFFDIDQSGIITNTTFLPLGVFVLHIMVNDTIGYSLSGVFTVTIEDESPPTWSELPTDQIIGYEEFLHYDLNATDMSGLQTWWLNDTTRFAINENGLVTIVSLLSVGTYGIHVWVNDTCDNVLDGEFRVMVIDTVPPSWTLPPSDQIAEMGEPLISILNATDPAGLHMWWLNETSHFTIGENGIITNTSILVVGVYGLQVSVNDTLGNVLSDEFTIFIVDTTLPEWLVPVTDQHLEYGEGLEYQLLAFDISGIDHWSLNDTMNFHIGTSGLITNKTALDSGQYGLLITVLDPYGNELSAELTVFVGEEITTPTTSGFGDINPILPYIVGAVLAGASIVIIIVVFFKKR